MIARCDPCGGPLAVTYRAPRGVVVEHYYCRNGGHVRVDKPALDDLVEAVMLAYLARPDVAERLTAAPNDGSELEAARDAIAEIRSELDALADKVGHGEMSVTFAARAERGLVERLEAAEAREAELSTPSVLRGLITPGADVARRWRAAPMSARREVGRILLAPDVLGELRVTRSPTPGRRADVADRVVWRTT